MRGRPIAERLSSGLSRPVVGLLAALGLLVALGWWAGDHQAATRDAEMRDRMVRQAEEIARIVNPDLAQRLTFTAADRGAPAYEIIREQMTARIEGLAVRGIFSMSMRGGRLNFGPETYPENDPVASPPGTEYREPPAEIQGVFQTGQAAVAGPYTDEYGTFVTAYAPVLDLQSDQVILVVGVDTLAGDWQAEVDGARWAPLLAALGAFLLLLAGAAVVRWRNRRRSAADLTLRAWILVPVAVAMLAGITVLFVYQDQQVRGESRRDAGHLVDQAGSEWNRLVSDEARTLRAQVDRIIDDPALLDAWQHRDLEALTALSRPVLDELKSRFDTTHLSFVEPDRTCFLCADDPARRGDTIDRFTMLTASRTGVDAWGVELGPLGTFTLRYVRPWIVDGGTIGYLELGVESNRLTDALARDLAVDLVSVVRKEYTSQASFEAGKRAFGLASSWDDYPDLVVEQQTLPILPDELIRWLRAGYGGLGDEGVSRLHQGNRAFDAGFVPLPDAAGHHVAGLLVIRDVTVEADAAGDAQFLALGLVLAFLAGVLALLWSITGRAERQLAGAFASLRDSEESYRRQFADNSAAMLLYDPTDGAILDANSAALSFLGHARERLLAMRITEINTAPASEVLRLMASITPEAGRQFEFQYRLADGSVRDVEVSASQIRLGERRVLHSIVHDITERKQAERAVQAERDRAQQYLDVAGVILVNVAPDGSITLVNRAGCDLLGYTQEELIGRNWFDVVFREVDRDRIRTMFARVMRGEAEPVDLFESYLVTRNGDERYVSWHNVVLRDASGVSVGMLTSGEDITERKRAEDALRESEERLRLVLQGSNDGWWDRDMEGEGAFFSPRWWEMLGYAEGELPADPGLRRRLTHPDDVERVDRLLNAAYESGQPSYEAEFRLHHKDGHWVPVLSRGFILRDETGRPVRVSGANTDLTERKRVEDALRASEIRTRAITDSAQDAILMMDPEGLVSYWNPAAERMFGYTSIEATSRYLHTMIAPPRYLEAFQAAFAEYLHTGRGAAVGKTLDLVACRRDGSEFPVQLSLSALQLNGEWHAVGIMRDITVQKLAETEQLEANRRLEDATSRANVLAAQAELANVAKSQFLANMSHEIRTPMNGVIGMTGLLLDTELDEDQRHYAETVRASGESLLALLNDILDFSKIEAGRLELETLDFDLRALLDDFTAALALQAQDKGLEFICAAAPDVPAHLSGDPGRLRQVLLNLAGNAVKFTHEGEIVVRASVASETDADVVLRFSVKDTGIGIPADKQGLLFQKFTQADASTTRQYGGTGLGLAISKQLAEMMGGEIGLVSEEGRGSEFWFTARLAKQAGGEHAVAPPAEVRGAHILVVDDNATNREVLAAQLKAWGVRSEETPDGPTALLALARARDAGDPFTAAVLDMQMPGMDGADLARAIKADETLAHTHLVLMTSLGQRGDARQMAEIGFAAYLVKPARQSDLFDCLSAVLAGAEVTQLTQPIVTRHTIREMRRGAVRILLAEDNITNQQVALGILKKLGLRADAVANGAEAVRSLESLPYDLVLMDVQMPEMDGFEATRRIRDPRSAVQQHGIPIIAMTAHALVGDRERCLEAGMDDYVAKPISPQALADALAKWLPREDSAPPAPALSRSGAAAPPAAEDEEVPVFDRVGMLARLMDDEDLARSVVHGFLEDIPRQIEALRSHVHAGDAAAVVLQAHTIKGASANVGGETLRAVALQVEQAAQAGDLEAARARLPDVESQFARLRQAMDGFVGEELPRRGGSRE